MSDIVNLREWGIIGGFFGIGYMLTGIADHHPTLGDNAFVGHSSIIRGFKIENNIAVVQTVNRIYHCPLEFLKPYNCLNRELDVEANTDMLEIFAYVAYTEVKKKLKEENKEVNIENLSNCDIDENMLNRFLEIDELIKQGYIKLEQMKKEKDEYLISKAKEYENSLYIELSTISNGNDAAYHFGDLVGVISPFCHTGMFQDSILYMKDGIVDFRYWPYPSSMMDAEIYNWSNGLDNVVIKNCKKEEIVFNGQTISSGETVIIDKSNYRCGLVSPDVVDGQSVLYK